MVANIGCTQTDIGASVVSRTDAVLKPANIINLVDELFLKEPNWHPLVRVPF